ncbi:hypothetical protein [Deinococcus petrolearius]|uniref:Uncharacterized protein n=1 Tax=Deinococcus petrolearius TaxID=1751295 RepID=A0ABW1DFE3_9DEIO
MLEMLADWLEASERHFEADEAIGNAIHSGPYNPAAASVVRARYGDTEAIMHAAEDKLHALSPAHLRALAAQAEAGDEMEGIRAALRGSRGTHNPHLYTGENARRDAWWRGNAQVWRLVDETACQHAESAYSAGMLNKNRAAALAAAQPEPERGEG